MVSRSLDDLVRLCAVLAAALGAASCGVESDVFGPMLDDGLTRLPLPADTVLVGQASALPGGAVVLLEDGASPLAESETTVDADGGFVERLDGAYGGVGLVAWITSGQRVLAAIVPEVEPQPTIFHEEHVLGLWDLHPSLEDVDESTTAAALIVAAAGHRFGLSLNALPPRAIRGAMDEVAAALAAGPGSDVHLFGRVVATLDEGAGSGLGDGSWLDAQGFEGTTSFLSATWAAMAGLDYDGDGDADHSTTAFDLALLMAAEEIDLDICFEESVIPVVFHVDLNDGVKNRNCSVVDHYKHSSLSADKTVFFTGGVHVDTPICSDDRDTHCLTESEVDAVNALLGNWTPNVRPMFDDATHGDAVANDGIWTLAVELPYLPTETSPDGAGLRLGYKYTFGQASMGWTDTEEWPGNQRLLEVEDVSGDRRVVRYDIFGDEAANKDFVNMLSPAKGGCGQVTWEADRPDACAGGTRENRVGADGECDVSLWDDPGPVPPLTIECAAE